MNRRYLADRKGIIHLFSGAGGFTWGWERAGFSTRVAIDHDVVATRTHELNFPHALTLNQDLSKFGPDDLLEQLGGRSHGLLAVVGGPPCQGWSKAGRGKLRSLSSVADSLLKDPRNQLYRRFLDFVNVLRPPVCVMENVPGMASIEGRNVAELIRTHFERMRYRCSVELVNARWFGVPQDRRRLIFICTREDVNLGLSASRLENYAARFRRDTLGLPAGDTTVRQAIGDLPPIEHGSLEDPRPYHSARRLTRYAQLMREGSAGMVADHITRKHNAQDLKAFASMPEGGIYRDLDPRLKRYRDDIFHDKYRRLRWDAPSGTVTAHLAKDVYSHIHPEQPRTLSIREAARLQSFPDNFRFFGNWGDRYRQIGNAVPALMSHGVASYIKEQIELGDRA